MTTRKDAPQQIKFVQNQNIPTHFADFAQCSVRTDDMALLRFGFSGPDGSINEEVRIAGTQEFLKRLIDLLAKQINYYPVPAKMKGE